ncbi:MAG: phosphoadenylyl-sulfate reductase, partial [Elusimicrobiota bacterium]
INIETLFPEKSAVEKMQNDYGPNLFYDGIEKRKMCCRIRKVEPLKKKLSTLKAWICGLRREQSVTRTAVEKIERDEVFKLYKINPLIDWTESMVWKYIKENNVPYNKLHDRGYPSIGCAPCTRAVKPGEDIRAGRWWWENPEHKECGLHQ